MKIAGTIFADVANLHKINDNQWKIGRYTWTLNVPYRDVLSTALAASVLVSFSRRLASASSSSAFGASPASMIRLRGLFWNVILSTRLSLTAGTILKLDDLDQSFAHTLGGQTPLPVLVRSGFLRCP